MGREPGEGRGASLEAVALALGSNLGSPMERLREGVRGLIQAGVRPRAVSSVWRSAAEGFAAQPDFLNAVLIGWWAGTPPELLAVAHGAERDAGRTRAFPNAPRTLDVDLIFVAERIRHAPPPILPHPRWCERAFVLAPLAEVAPSWRDPVGGSTVHEIWSSRSSALPRARIVAPPSALWSPPP